jgi:hypothetical protein
VLAVRRVLALLLLGLALVACSAIGAATRSPSPSATATQPPASSSQPSTDTEIKCDLGGHDAAYHIHALVGVKVNGALYAPPANIGIGTDCMYWVHTHAADGIVHIEAPASVSPTLGDFLGLWAKSYPDDELLKTAHEEIAAGKVTVNDAPISSNPLDLVLADRMRIILGS